MFFFFKFKQIKNTKKRSEHASKHINIISNQQYNQLEIYLTQLSYIYLFAEVPHKSHVNCYVPFLNVISMIIIGLNII